MCTPPTIAKVLAFIFALVAVIVAMDYWTVLRIFTSSSMIDDKGVETVILSVDMGMFMGPTGTKCEFKLGGVFGELMMTAAADAMKEQEAQCAAEIAPIASAFMGLVPWGALVAGLTIVAMMMSTVETCNCCKCGGMTDADGYPVVGGPKCICCNPRCCGISSTVLITIEVIVAIVATGALGVALSEVLGIPLSAPVTECQDMFRRQLEAIPPKQMQMPSLFKHPVHSIGDLKGSMLTGHELLEEVMGMIPMEQRNELLHGRSLATPQVCSTMGFVQEYLFGFTGMAIFAVLFIIMAIVVACKPTAYSSADAAPAGDAPAGDADTMDSTS